MTAEAHAAPPASPSAVVAPLQPNERDELAHYLASSPDETLPAEHWRQRMDLWWDDNPYFGADSVRGWTVRADGKLVGFFGVVAHGFQLAGRETVAYGSTTWRVDPAHRHNSLTGIAKVLGYARGSLLFISTQTAALVKVLEALKFVKVERGEHFYARAPNTLPVRIDGLGRLLHGPARSVAVAALSIPNAMARLYPRLVRARLALGSRGLRVRELDRADASFDALWSRTRAQHSSTIARTAAFVQWQCFGSAVRRKKLLACYRGEDLVGFAMIATRTGRMRVHQCVDLWTDATVDRVTDALVGGMVDGALRDGVDLLEVPAFAAELFATTRRSGFVPRRLPDRGEFVLGPKDALASLRASDAYLSLLQGDSGL